MISDSVEVDYSNHSIIMHRYHSLHFYVNFAFNWFGSYLFLSVYLEINCQSGSTAEAFTLRLFIKSCSEKFPKIYKTPEIGVWNEPEMLE